jgi:hypothetical protein
MAPAEVPQREYNEVQAADVRKKAKQELDSTLNKKS